MSEHTRDLYQVAVTPEVTRLTSVNPSAGDWLDILESPKVKEAHVKKENMSRKGVLSTAEGDRLFTKSYELSIKMHMDRIHTPKFLKSILGYVSTTANSPQTGTHTHVVARHSVLSQVETNLMPTLTVTTWDPTDGYKQFAGAVVTGVKMMHSPQEYVTLDITLLAPKKVTASGVSTPSYNTQANDTEFLPSDGQVKEASTVAGLTGATAVDIGSLEISLERPASIYYALGVREGVQIISGKLSVKANLTKLYANTTYQGYAQSDASYRAMQLLLADSATVIGTSTNPSVTVLLPRVSFRSHEVDEKDDYTEEKMEVLATRDETDGDIKVTVVNTTASY